MEKPPEPIESPYSGLMPSLTKEKMIRIRNLVETANVFVIASDPKVGDGKTLVISSGLGWKEKDDLISVLRAVTQTLEEQSGDGDFS